MKGTDIIVLLLMLLNLMSQELLNLSVVPLIIGAGPIFWICFHYLYIYYMQETNKNTKTEHYEENQKRVQKHFENVKRYLENDQGWKIGKKIGEGYSSRIYAVSKSHFFEEKACKIVCFTNEKQGKKEIRKMLSFDLQTELLSHLSGVKGISQYQQGAKTQQWGHFIMDFFPNGNLHKYIPTNDKKLKLVSEITAEQQGRRSQKCREQGIIIATLEEYSCIMQDILAKLVQTLSIIHQRGVIHRDLKLSNIMLDKLYNPFIIDFGLALVQPQICKQFPIPQDIVEINEKLNAKNDFLVGTREYICPELISGKNCRIISPKIDIWALGVISYQILSKGQSFPFYGSTLSQLNQKIRNQQPDYSFFTPQQTQFLRACLKKDPLKRSSADQLMKLPYFNSINFSKLKNRYNPINRILNPQKFQQKVLFEIPQTSNMTYSCISQISGKIKKTHNISLQIMQNREGEQLMKVLETKKKKNSIIATIQLRHSILQKIQNERKMQIYELQKGNKMHWLQFGEIQKMESLREHIGILREI